MWWVDETVLEKSQITYGLAKRVSNLLTVLGKVTTNILTILSRNKSYLD